MDANYPYRQAAEPGLRDFLNILFKRKGKIALCFFGILFLVVFITIISTKIYESEAKIYVNAGRKSMPLNLASDFRERILINQSMENQVNSEIEILNSPELIKKVVAILGPKVFYENSETYGVDKVSFTGNLRYKLRAALSFPKKAMAGFMSSSEKADSEDLEERTANRIKNSLKVEHVEESSVIRLSFASHHPRLARDALATLINEYLKKHRELVGTPKSYDFFTRESSKTAKELQAAENRIKEFKNEINVGSLEVHRQILSQQIGVLGHRLKNTKSDIDAFQRMSHLDGKNRGLTPAFFAPEETSGVESPAINDMRDRIYELKIKEQELLSSYKENSVPVMEARRQIREAEALFQEAKRSMVGALQAHADSLDFQIQKANQELKALNDSEFKIAQMEREKQLLEKKYQAYSHNLEQSRIDQALEMEEISNIKIVQAPIIPNEAIKPKTKINLILGFMLALLASLGLAFFAEYFDHSLQSPEQVEDALDISVLGSVEKMKK